MPRVRKRRKDHPMIELVDYGSQVPTKPIRKGTRIDPRGDRVQGATLQAECWLDRYHNRGQLDDAQYEAGLRFRRAWEAAGLQPHVTGSYGQRIGGKGSVATAAIGGSRTVMEACRLVGSIRAGVLVDVCGLDNAAGSAKRIQWLQEGLLTLAREWGIDSR